jgi:N-methylhydantoinase A
MGGEARDAFAQEGHRAPNLGLAFSLDMRFEGQEASLPVPLPATGPAGDLRRGFLDAYRGTYGYVSDDRVETVAIRLIATLEDGAVLDFSALRAPETEEAAAWSRRAYFGKEAGWIEVPVMRRSALRRAADGPLILESDDCTVVIPPFASVVPDKAGNLLVTLA